MVHAGAVRSYILCHVIELNKAEQLVSVQVSGNNRCIVLWSVVMVDPSSSFDDFLRPLKAGKYSIVSPSESLLRAIIIENVASYLLERTESMSIVGEDMDVVTSSARLAPMSELKTPRITEGP